MTKIPIRTALLWIWGSTIVFSGGVVLTLSLKNKWNAQLYSNPKFKIQALIQKCSSVESLSTDYLAECLGLGLDRSYTIFEYSSDHLTGSLEASPLIRKASVKKILPATLEINYSLRQPVAILQDYQNTVMDEDGVLFPLQPFRTPKLLPEITLGEQSETRIKLALEVLRKLKNAPSVRLFKGIQRIDVSRIDSKKLSRRELVVVLNAGEGKSVFIRLPAEAWKEALSHFFLIPQEQLPQKIVDMRLSNTAYLSNATGGSS